MVMQHSASDDISPARCTWQWNVDGGMLPTSAANLRQLACARIAALLVSADEQDVGIIIEDVMGAIAMMDVIVENEHLHHIMQHAVSCVAIMFVQQNKLAPKSPHTV